MQIQELTDKERYSPLWKTQAGHILQSWQWGEIKRGAWQPLRLELEHAGESRVMTILVRKLPVLGIKVGYCPRITFPQNLESDTLESLRAFVKANDNCDFVLLESDYTDTNLPQVLKESGRIDYSVQPACSNRVDLQKSEQELWGNLKGSYRRNINKADRQGVVIREITEGSLALDQFYDVMADIFKNTSYVMHSKDYFGRVWQKLTEAGLAKIFLAEQNGRIVGAYLVAYDENVAYEFYGGVTQAGRDVEAGYQLKWKAMLDARQMGKKFYDHWGVAPRLENGEYDPKHELGNISNFKAGFGGTDICFAKTVALVISAPKYKLFKFLLKLQALNIGLRKIVR